jgi:arsenate reductase (glutaredoxin)
LLAEKGVEFERRDYFKDPFTVDELRSLFSQVGLKPSDVISKRSKAYKDLGLAERELSEEQLLELMPENPTLLRRPLVIEGDRAVVGFKQNEIESLIE